LSDFKKHNWLRIGDWIEFLIKVFTLNQGKKIFAFFRERRGKYGCGCDARKKWLNNIGARLIGAKPE
tara:strand:+ start:224 stop:424 length:201 start_codon:yes stop_codon:yes gene_type:complete